MADIPLYEGETVTLHWGATQHVCRVYRSRKQCAVCGGPVIEIDPPWETWRLLCTKESTLTTTPVQRDEALRNLRPGAIGVVSSIPVRIRKGGA